MYIPKEREVHSMVLHFNVKGENKKAMVTAIESETGVKARYLGVPSSAYEIGNYTVGRNGELEFGDFDDLGEVTPIVEACVKATGVKPSEWDNGEKAEEQADIKPNKGAESEQTALTVSIPLDKVLIGNLTSILDAKGNLIKKALGITDIRIEVEEDKVSFPWFEETKPDETLAYTKFITALCEMSVKQKRITAKPKENENEKYAFRCFLLRLGFIGDEYKADRKILLSKLEGSSAFKYVQKGGGQ